MKRLAISTAALLLLLPIKPNAQEMKRKDPNINASYQILIDAPINTVWQTLAVDYGGIGKWASGVNHVIESSGEGITAKRSCEISAAGFNDTKEKVIEFDPEQHYFAYDLYEGLPGFVKYSVNSDRLEERGGQTLLTSTNKMRVGGFMGLTMKGIMKSKLEDVLEAKAKELKYYIEKSRPHPDKLKAMAKLENKKLFVLNQDIEAPIHKVWEVIADDFAHVSDSHPVSSHSEFISGSSKVEEGSQRIMYMSENRKKYFIDEILRLDEDMHNMLIGVVEAKGYPVSFSNVEFFADPLSTDKSRLTMVFSYQTKPRFLQGLATGSLEKQLQQYLYAIDYHVKTGEAITKENWKSIRKNYK